MTEGRCIYRSLAALCQSESVDAYVSKHDKDSPLGQYLYGSASFASDEEFSAAAA